MLPFKQVFCQRQVLTLRTVHHFCWTLSGQLLSPHFVCSLRGCSLPGGNLQLHGCITTEPQKGGVVMPYLCLSCCPGTRY